ncbi:MAG: type II secretion system F family protein [Armatimonadetes bacterium]|nr:type II secretion system F family protein [Armatimonadota bacterium]
MMTSDTPLCREHFRALLLFSSAFATLIGSGVNLIHSVRTLARHAPAPYNQGAEELATAIDSGQTLSRAMSGRPDLFTPFYIAMVRIGEVGGILDETLRIVVDCLAAEWKVRPRRRAKDLPPFLSPTQREMPQHWGDLTGREGSLVLMLFCQCLGAVLSAGVPAKLALETVAELLPATQRHAVRSIPGEVLAQGITRPLAEVGFLPPLILMMIGVGEECGALPRMLEKAAGVYQFEVECDEG